MSRFSDLPVAALLDALSSSEPTPGGGTASALAGAMGISLLMMVAGLAKSRHDTDAERRALADVRVALAAARERITRLADDDAEAFNQVMAAYRRPKSTDAEKAARKQAIQQALGTATAVPLDTLRTAVAAVTHARIVAECGNRSAASDVRVALELLEAAAAGATANVEINLHGLADEASRNATATEVLNLGNQLTQSAATARAALDPTRA